MELHGNTEFKQDSEDAFASVAHRAHVHPSLYCVQCGSRSKGPVPDFDAVVTSRFEPAKIGNLLAELALRGNRRGIQSAAASAFSLIRGADHQLLFVDSWPEVAVKGTLGEEDMTLPLALLSRGEQVIVAFCVYLALTHDQVTAGMCLGFTDSVTSMDLQMQSNLFNCLGQFSSASGVSLYIEVSSRDTLQLAERMLSPSFASAQCTYIA